MDSLKENKVPVKKKIKSKYDNMAVVFSHDLTDTSKYDLSEFIIELTKERLELLYKNK
jgi:hypothetical protein